MKCRINPMTQAQKKATEEYCIKWLRDEAMPKVTRNVEAIILWQLYEQCGWGKKRLLRFLNKTAPLITGILDDYDWHSDEDAIWYCEYKLKSELGIDLSLIDSPFRETEVKMK